MATLSPVDFNPFSLSAAGGSFIPVDHDPFQSQVPFTNAQEQPSSLADAAKSFAGGVEKGAVALPMVLPNLINQIATGPQLLGRGIASGVDKLAGIPEQPRDELWKPFYGSEDVINQLPEAVQPHEPQTMAGILPDVFGQLLGNVAAGKGLQAAAPKVAELASNEQSGTPPSTTPSPQDIKAASQAAYGQMKANGATLNQNGLQTVTGSVNNALTNSGLMNPQLHGDTMAVVKSLNDDAASGTMSLEKLDQYRQLLNQVVSKNTDKINGQNPDAYKSNIAINALDSAVDSLSGAHLSNGSPQSVEALNNARALYSAQAKMSDVQRIIDNAEMTDNPATAIKTGFRTLAKQVNVNPRGYTPEEVDAINHAAKTGLVTGALKTMGSRIISGVAGGAGGAVGAGWPGAMVGAAAGEAAGAPMRAAANALQASRGQKVIDLIGNRPAVQTALGNPPMPVTPPPSIASTVATSMNTSAAQQALQKLQPATGNIGEQNMQELQKLRPTAIENNKPVNPIEKSQANAGDFFTKMQKVESGNNPQAKNPNSSASGAFQFIDSTWKQMVKRYGAETGIRLEDKNDPKAQQVMAQLYAKDNINQMQPFLKRLPTKGELYAAHLLGADGALRLINTANSMPDKQAMMLFPKAVTAANHNVFFKGSTPRTALEVYQFLSQKVS